MKISKLAVEALVSAMHNVTSVDQTVHRKVGGRYYLEPLEELSKRGLINELTVKHENIMSLAVSFKLSSKARDYVQSKSISESVN